MSATPAEALIRERIAASPHGRLPWCEVMRIALYEPGIGYYRRGVRRIGRGGDFFTSVSVGPVFGELAALFCARVWRALGCPNPMAIIEQGANDGRLARDILEALERAQPDLFLCIQYWIVEPDQDHREAQALTLGSQFSPRLRHAASLPALDEAPGRGVFICNELLDAFPAHRVTWEEGGWKELYVAGGDGRALSFTAGPVSSDGLQTELAAMPVPQECGYTTDVNLEMQAWIRQLTPRSFSGAVWVLDYGLPEAEYLAESRSQGTLRRHWRHQMDDRVLEQLGESDLTTHVNFTRLALAAESLGFQLCEFIEQGRFLTRLAAHLFTGTHAPPSSEWIRQFHTLTHPDHLGMSFHSLVLGKGMDLADMFTPAESAAARRRLGL